MYFDELAPSLGDDEGDGGHDGVCISPSQYTFPTYTGPRPASCGTPEYSHPCRHSQAYTCPHSHGDDGDGGGDSTSGTCWRDTLMIARDDHIPHLSPSYQLLEPGMELELELGLGPGPGPELGLELEPGLELEQVLGLERQEPEVEVHL